MFWNHRIPLATILAILDLIIKALVIILSQ